MGRSYVFPQALKPCGSEGKLDGTRNGAQHDGIDCERSGTLGDGLRALARRGPRRWRKRDVPAVWVRPPPRRAERPDVPLRSDVEVTDTKGVREASVATAKNVHDGGRVPSARPGPPASGASGRCYMCLQALKPRRDETTPRSKGMGIIRDLA